LTQVEEEMEDSLSVQNDSNLKPPASGRQRQSQQRKQSRVGSIDSKENGGQTPTKERSFSKDSQEKGKAAGLSKRASRGAKDSSKHAKEKDPPPEKTERIESSAKRKTKK